MMYGNIKATLMKLTFDELQSLNQKNDLRIEGSDLEIFHHLLTEHWQELMDESSLSLIDDTLSKHCNLYNLSKYHELITSIKRNIIFNKR